MTGDPFDLFGGTTDLPDDAADEIDLSQLDALKPAAAGSDQESEDDQSSSAEPSADSPREESHWLDLASSLGVAIGSTQFEAATESRPAKPAPVARPRKKPPAAAKPADEEESDDSAFGRGLLDEVAPTEEESRQRQLLSELFVPTGEPVPETDAEARQIDDVEFIDEDMVEFEVEELSRGDEPPSTGFGQSAPEPSQTEAPADRAAPPPRESGNRDRSRGRGRDRDRGRNRDDGRRRPPRGESRQDRPRRDPPPTQVRSEVLPVDEDFIIDPIDEESELAQQANLKDTKSIKFPTWIETVTPIIESNIARRGKGRDRSRRGSRDRGDRNDRGERNDRGDRSDRGNRDS